MDEKQPSALRPILDPALEFSDSELFWQEHWQKFAAGLAAIVVAILLVGAWMLWQAHQRSSAEAAFSMASNIEGWRGVIDAFPRTIPSGNARLRIADTLRGQGDLAGAIAELEQFTSAQPDHPLAGAAWLMMGQLRQAEGSKDMALDAFRISSSRYKDAYTAPLAMISEADLLAAQGQTGEARAILESIGKLYPETPAAMVAGGEANRLAPAGAAAPSEASVPPPPPPPAQP